ncbi:centromere protein I [Neodiprion pinetum]|uniref:Centromere protein I n=1 Tax=Neodiprion lecontei TaxID=441921 RepID=A0A6J0BT94_NEOLC|nr:centromere protein I [Neodiprion lecontei]XP_046482452.1 centromere protein I-like [Neodiprion pinetum]
MTAENVEVYTSYLKRCKDAGKLLAGFSEMLTMLKAEVSTSGLPDEQIQLLIYIITKITMGSTHRAALIKCLIPIHRMTEKIVQDIGLWFISTSKNIPVLPGIAVLQWFTGLLNYGLVEAVTINAFYDAFFFILVKNTKFEPFVAQLIYVLTKPEDVTRRQVSRILKLQSQYAKPRKHLTALLSLFKSYKPEHVPEKIPATNVESAWKRLPESLRLDLQDAAKRCDASHLAAWQPDLVWNPVTSGAQSRKQRKMPIPTVSYINIGSSISKEPDAKSIFEIRTLDELGKHQLSLELPCNALSLLANNAGLHILTFASSDYQSRFCYNLYNTLQNAFIYEVGKFSYQDRERLLFMTAQLSRYMQQEIILVSRFLKNYLPFWNTRDHRDSIFALIQWITISSFTDVHRNILLPLQTMWESSSINVKCEILTTLRSMVTNLFMKNEFKDRDLGQAPLFLETDAQSLDIADVIDPLMKFTSDLIVSGLYSESNNGILVSEALIFYQHVSELEKRSDLPCWTISPSVVIYSGLVSRSMAILSGVCALLLRYRGINAKLRELNRRDLFETKIKIIDTYATDIAKSLLYNEAFCESEDRCFLRGIPEPLLLDFRTSCAFDTALNISNHFAILPYKFSLIDMGLEIVTTEDCISVAETYYPEVAKFLQIISE